jgi:hypothetical protein
MISTISGKHASVFDKPDPDEAREQKLDEALDRAWSDEP